ncbi:MAG: MFS transporter, partial [Planctomycetota bacterium]
MAEDPTTPDATGARPGTLELALLTFLCMLPVTLVVPVLKGLVRDKFETGDFGVSLFMSINMIAAVIFGPFSGVLSKRISPRISIPLMLAADAILFAGLSLTSTWNTFVVLRFLEGAAHIGALSILLGLCAEISRRQVGRDGRLMGIVGAALTLGVAAGPPLGGKIGAEDPIAVFRFGAGLAATAAVFGFLILRKLPTLETVPGQDKPAVFQLARERKRLLLPFLFAFCDRFTVGFFVTSFPLYLATCHEVPSARIGLLLALFLLLPFALLCYPA